MPVIRATFFFKQRKWGWSESLFSTRADRQPALDDAIAYLPIRVALNGVDTTCEYIRISDDLIKRDSLIFAPPTEDQKARSITVGESDIPNTCIVMRMQSSPTGRRTLSMRGIPDRIVTDGGLFTPGGAWNGAFLRWRNEIISGRWGIKVKDQAQPQVNITGIAWDQPSLTTTITFDNNIGIGTGEYVQLGGQLPTNLLRGIFKVTAAGLNFVKVRTPFLVPAYTGFAWGRKVVYSVAAITSCVALRASHRNAGRPFDSPVGRRRGR